MRSPSSFGRSTSTPVTAAPWATTSEPVSTVICPPATSSLAPVSSVTSRARIQHVSAADVERPGRGRQDERRGPEVENRPGFDCVGRLQPARIGDRVVAEILRRRRVERPRRRGDDDEREDGESQRGALRGRRAVVSRREAYAGTFAAVNATNGRTTAELGQALYPVAAVRHDARP
jgi:hypothetical protein